MGFDYDERKMLSEANNRDFLFRIENILLYELE